MTSGTRRIATLVALAGAAACRKPTEGVAPVASDAAAPSPAAVSPGTLAWPATIKEVLFTSRGDFVAFQDETNAVLVDLRSRMGVARNASAPLRPDGTAKALATRRDGELGLVGPGRLEELATGKIIEVQGELRPDYVLGADPAGTVVTLYDGTLRSFPPGLRPLGPSDLLAGMVERAGGTVAVVAEPRTGRVFEPEEGTSVDTAARVGDGSKVLVVVHSHAGPMKVVVYGADPRKPLASSAVSGLVLGLEISADGKSATWSEVQKTGATARCSGVVYLAATDVFTRTPPFPCDPQTGGRLPKAPAKLDAGAPAAPPSLDAGSDIERSALSPDGAKLAVVTGKDVRVVEVKTGATLFRAAR